MILVGGERKLPRLDVYGSRLGLGFRASFRSASPLPSAERRFSATAPVVGSVLPFEETKTGRGSRGTVISRARLRIFPSERRQITRPQIMADPSATWLK